MNQVTDNHHQQTSIHQDAGTVNYYNDNNSASTAMIRGDPRNNDNGMTTMNPRVLERQMFAAFADLDPDLSLELRQALATAPALVYGESKFLDFLRTELYDVPKAAVRIANYWKFRRELFQDRWLLPMTQTGRGALTSEQVQLLRSGFKVLLHDNNSCVCMSNYSRLPPGAEYYYDFCPIYFYHLSVETNAVAQLDGLVNFYAVTTGFRKVPDLSWDRVVKLGTSLPFKIHHTVVGRMFDYQRSTWLNDMAAATVSKNCRELGLEPSCVALPSVRSTVNALEDIGLDRSFIPVDMGGDYFYSQQFDEWIRARLSLEDAMAAAPPVRNAVTANHRGVQQEQFKLFLAQQEREQYEDDNDNNKDGPHIVELSRNDPQDAVTDKKKKSKPKKERKKMVKQEPGESREAFLKRRDYLYGRRSYYNKQRRKNELHQEYELAKLTNTRLKTEHQRLEVLMQQANCLVRAETKKPSDEQQDTSSSAESSTRQCAGGQTSEQ